MNFCTCFIYITFPDNLKRITHMPSFITLFIYFTIHKDFYFKPIRKCIYNRSSNSMQTTGNLISPTAEFTTGMKNSKYNFYSRNTCFMVDPYRNSTSVIFNRDRIILINRHVNCITKTCKSFIY